MKTIRNLYRKIQPFRDIPLPQFFGTVLGCSLGLGTVSCFSVYYHVPLLIASFGATSMLVFAYPHLPMAQPRNVIGGHIISAFVGVSIYQLLGMTWISITLAAMLAILAMIITSTSHPPGGATALIAVMTGADYSFIFMPITFGAVILVCSSIIINYFIPGITYPVPHHHPHHHHTTHKQN